MSGRFIIAGAILILSLPYVAAFGTERGFFAELDASMYIMNRGNRNLYGFIPQIGYKLSSDYLAGLSFGYYMTDNIEMPGGGNKYTHYPLRLHIQRRIQDLVFLEGGLEYLSIRLQSHWFSHADTSFTSGSEDGRDHAFGPFIGLIVSGPVGRNIELVGRASYSFTQYKGTKLYHSDIEIKRDVGGISIDFGLKYNF
jgi:hypothetical protein